MEIWDKKDAVKNAIKNLTFIKFDEETINELTHEIVQGINILEEANLNRFKSYIKGDPKRVSAPAGILLEYLNDSEYMLCMHFGNKIIDAMIEYAHRLVDATETNYQERLIK
jgi:hypothetical protein